MVVNDKEGVTRVTAYERIDSKLLNCRDELRNETHRDPTDPRVSGTRALWRAWLTDLAGAEREDRRGRPRGKPPHHGDVALLRGAHRSDQAMEEAKLVPGESAAADDLPKRIPILGTQIATHHA